MLNPFIHRSQPQGTSVVSGRILVYAMKDSYKSLKQKTKSERTMDTDEDEQPIRAPMKRKKASALISSDEEDDAKVSPPRKKTAVSSPKKNVASSTSKSQPPPKQAPARKPAPKKSKDMNFIVASDSESEDDYSAPKTKGEAAVKKAPAKAETSKKSTGSKSEKDAGNNKANEGDKPKPKVK